MALVENITGPSEVEKLYPSLEELPPEKSAQIKPQKTGALSRKLRTETSVDASSSLFRALKPGLPPISEETLRTLIANGADPNYTESGESVLSRAIDQHLDIGYISALFESGVLPSAQETKALVIQHGKSIITRAEEANVHLFDSLLQENQIDHQFALSILRSGASIDFVSKNGNNSPLVLAITKGANKALVEEMIKQGGDLKNENGTLGSALEEFLGTFGEFDDEKADITLLLINAGAPIDFTNMLGEVIEKSRDAERPELIEVLLARGVDPNGDYKNITPIVVAINQGSYSALDLFHQRGIEFKVPHSEKYGNWMIYYKSDDTPWVNVERLKNAYKVDTLSEGSLGPTLVYTTLENSYPFSHMFNDLGFDPRTPFDNGKTLLTTAIAENYPTTKVGAIINSSDYSIEELSGGVDLIQLAYETNRPDVYLMLLQKGYQGGEVSSNFAEEVLSKANAMGKESPNFSQVEFWAKKYIDNYNFFQAKQYLLRIKEAKDKAFSSIENKAKKFKQMVIRRAEDEFYGFKDKIYNVTRGLFGNWRDSRNDREID